MGLITIPLRLAAKYRLVAADVASAFGALVTAINGNLTADNFSRRMKLPNAMKGQQYGLVPIHIRCPMPASGPTVRFHAAIPGQGGGVLGDAGAGLVFEIVRWTMTFSTGGPVSGSAKLYRNNSSGVLTQVGSTEMITSMAARTVTFNTTLSSSPAGQFDTRLAVDLQFTSGTSYDVVVTIWAKVKHVR